MLQVAMVLAQRATCIKLSVGCVLTDEHSRIIGSGYNGVPHRMPHCIDAPCEGAMLPAGSDMCEAVHAEQNALLNCYDVQRIATCYITHPPCLRCVKELLNTSCGRLVYFYDEPYSEKAHKMWLLGGRQWFHYPDLRI